MTESRYDAVVVGAGILGLFHAYFAAQSGLSVLLLERDRAPSSASTRNFGMLPLTIVETHGEWNAIARESADIYRSIQQQTDISVRSPGSLYLASTPLEWQVLQEFVASFGTQYGAELVTAGTVAQDYPFIRPDYCAGGLLFPADPALDPERAIHTLREYVTSVESVIYRGSQTVTAVARDGAGCVVRCAGGDAVRCEQVFVCSGAECSILFPQVFAQSGLEVCKLQMMATEPQATVRLPHSILSGLSLRRYPAFSGCASYGALLAEPLDPALADAGIHVLLKQTSDGSIIIGDSHQYRPCVDGAVYRERTSVAIDNSILGYARSMCVLDSWTIARRWNGYYLRHPDLPVFAHDIDERIHLITGIAGKGMTTGPGYARRSIARILRRAA